MSYIKNTVASVAMLFTSVVLCTLQIYTPHFYVI